MDILSPHATKEGNREKEKVQIAKGAVSLEKKGTLED